MLEASDSIFIALGGSSDEKEQCKEHRRGVMESLRDYLKGSTVSDDNRRDCIS